ncbi:MAG: hypothetical protein OXI25_01860 [Chloroflexota bacterium]|nr:hypothetical protein [Chloroflexota bacterium]
MAKISQDALRQVQAALENYRVEVNSKKLTSKTKKTYLLYVQFFVRWLDDDFVPGSRTG